MALGTAAILAAGSLAGTAIQANAANKAAGVQAQSAQNSLELQKIMYGETREALEPWKKAGGNALEAYMYELGLGEQPEGYEGYEMSPAGKYAMETGVGDVNAAFSARGGYDSGAALEALESKRRNIVTADTAEYFNRLAGMSNVGMGAATGQATAGQNYAGTATNTMMAGANSQAWGYQNAANAISGGINDAAGIYGYFQGQPNAANAYSAPTLTGGANTGGTLYSGADMMKYWMNL